MVDPLKPVNRRGNVFHSRLQLQRQKLRVVELPRSEIYRAANWLRTSLQAGEREDAFVARHCAIRPPPG